MQRLTIIAVISLGLFGLTQGLAIARFAALGTEGPPGKAVNPVQRAISYAPAQAESLLGWRNVAGVRELARSGYLADLAGAGRASPEEIEAAARDLLRAAPTSSLHWALLAVARLERDAPLLEILTPLNMSSITGPREAAALLTRVKVWLRLWARLPADARTVAIDQFIHLRAGLDATRQGELRSAIAAASAETRSEVRAALAARGADGAFIELLRI